MKSKNLTIGLFCVFIFMVVFTLTTKSQKPEETPKFEVVEIGTGGAYRWSPDGTRLAFLDGDYLCVADAEGKGEVQKIAQVKLHGFEWMSDSVFVVWISEPWRPRGKPLGRKFRIETLDMRGQAQLVREDSIAGPSEYLSWTSPPFVLKDGTVGYYEVHEEPEGETKVFKIIKKGSLKPEIAVKQMQLAGEGFESIDGIIKRKINYDRKWYYVKLSPDGSKILAHHYGLGIATLDTAGNIIKDFSPELPKVEPGRIADMVSASWSPDSKKIAYDVIVENEDTTYSRAIYIANFDGTDKIKIPEIPGEFIGGPAWSPDGTKIACRSESGKIFVIKVK
jgi:hypothetical protein